MKPRHIHNYHGRTVRVLFLALAIVLLLSSPWQVNVSVFQIPPIVITVTAVLFAGWLSSQHPQAYYWSTGVAVVFLVYFQYLVFAYIEKDLSMIAIITQVNMVLMVFAAYYSLRTTYAWEGPRTPKLFESEPEEDIKKVDMDM